MMTIRSKPMLMLMLMLIAVLLTTSACQGQVSGTEGGLASDVDVTTQAYQVAPWAETAAGNFLRRG